jgi:hypothetical protein
MLDEKEWAEVLPLLREEQQQIKQYRESHGAPLPEALAAARTARAQEKVQELTGYYEPEFEAIWHHRLADYGPECHSCAHLLRTKRARFCANCGASAAIAPARA